MCTPANTTTTTTVITTSPDDQTSDWRQEAINGGSLRHVDLETGTNGWSTPPPNLFHLRGPTFFHRRHKTPSDDPRPLLLPAGVDWLKSYRRLDHLLSNPSHRVLTALRRRSPNSKSFLIAVNLQIPAREHHHLSAVFYFASDHPIPPDTLLHRFVHGDDAYRNARFKIVNRIVKGPWIVRAAVGNYGACLLGKALVCRYYRGDNYLEIDVDISSSAIATAILKLALGAVTAVTIDMGFLVEAQSEEELPERLFGTVRISQMEMGSATFVDDGTAVGEAVRRGAARVNHCSNGGGSV